MKKNKQRKRHKRKKKVRGGANSSQTLPKISKNKQDHGFAYEEIENPFKNMSDDERKAMIQEMGKSTTEKYSKRLIELQNIAENHCPLSLLSILAAYATMGTLKSDGTQKSFLGDDLGQPQVELMQAICLNVPTHQNSPKPLNPHDVEKTFEALQEVSLSFAFQRLADTEMDLDEEKKAIRLLQEQIRGRTQTVRNWGYYNQVISTLKEIFSPLDKRYVQNFGFSATNVLDFFSLLVHEIEQKNNERIQGLAKLHAIKNPVHLVYKYYEWLDIEKEEAEEFVTKLDVKNRNVKEVFAMVLSHADFLLSENYIFNQPELSEKLALNQTVISNIVNAFSYKFGDLEDYNIDHIFLANPIWKKPLISIFDNKIFCSLPQVFFSFALTSLDELLRSVDVSPKNKDSQHLSDHRSNYLENKIAQIVRTRFPEAEVVCGLKWRKNNIEYETDLITIIDSQILIIEAKSGKISDSSLRGSPDRLKRDLDELLFHPSIQSLRLKNLLLELMDNPTKDDPIREKLPVDLAQIHKVHRVSVSLEDFATIQANIKNLSDTGWLPKDFEPCPTFCLGDFEVIFDILEHPAQIIHYIQQREILERNVKYMGDELDLLGWYIETLFNVPDFGEEYSQIILTGNSQIIDRYYIGNDHGLKNSKPEAKLYPLFKEVLKQLEKRKINRWTEIGVILHMLAPEDQKELIKLLPKLKSNVKKKWDVKGHENMLILKPAYNSKIALCYIFYNNHTANQRDAFIESGCASALEPEHVEQCLVIAKNIDSDANAYDFIALAGNEKFNF